MADVCVCHFFLSMAITSLAITNFRNLVGGSITFGPRVNVFYGANGSGKTNLLEAIFTVCLGRSQRGAADAVLVNEQAEHYRLEGSLATSSGQRTAAVAYQRGGRKRITIDSAPARASELFELHNLVAAGPEDSEILSGPPSARRLFLDLYLSQLTTTYLADLTDYQKALAQKNAALKREMDPTPFDPLLVKYGTRIMLQRGAFLSDLASVAGQAYERISGGEKLLVEYEPRVPFNVSENDDRLAMVAFEAALAKNAAREQAAQLCLVGPHRDEINFAICDLPARTHGSQGQWRAAAVALKLAVYEMLKAKRGEPPLLLLDEIFAELDPGRTNRLVESFGDVSQLFLTTASEPPDMLMAEARRFRVSGGTMNEE
jgi:DNA replication and repair protein RecF